MGKVFTIGKIKVWKITNNLEANAVALYLDDLATFNDVCGGIENEEIGNKYTFEVIEMSEKKYYELPEWDGWC